MKVWLGGWLVAGVMAVAGAAVAQDADLTIFVDGALLEHGGLVEVSMLAVPDGTTQPQIVTLTDRYAQITLRYPVGASYNFRFRPAPDAADRAGLNNFSTAALGVGTKTETGPDGEQEYDTQEIWVFPFAAYGGGGPAESISAIWGETQEFDDPPPANVWGARALPQVFDTFGDRRGVGLICTDTGAVNVCTPDPGDALLMEALWWRAIAEGRLERLRFNALDACYEGGGLLGRPERCTEDAGDGWPAYVPAD